MENSKPKQESFLYVREIYRNCIRILLNADLLMEERGFSKYDWKHVDHWYPDPNLAGHNVSANRLNDADKLLTGYLFHQYYEKDKKDKDIFTICTAPWRRCNEKEFTPICCATRFEAAKTPDAVYWIGAMPIWEKDNRTDGIAIKYNANIGEADLLREQDREICKDIMAPESHFFAASVPLLSVVESRNIVDLIDKVLNAST
jgi:hypothetical protein